MNLIKATSSAGIGYVSQLRYAYRGEDISLVYVHFPAKCFCCSYFSYNTKVYSVPHIGSPFTF